MAKINTIKPSTKRSVWAIHTREISAAPVWAVLYGLLSSLTNALVIPGAANVSVRPGVALLFFSGLTFGPWVGFFTGFFGNLLSDLLSGQGMNFWWNVGNGLMGFLPGLLAGSMINYRSLPDILKAEASIFVATAIGMGVASISELWMSNADLNDVLLKNFIPAFMPNISNGLILVPILLLVYGTMKAIQQASLSE